MLPRDRRAGRGEPGDPLWWPRALQGSGRHDNPGAYGCMYVSASPLSPLAEALAPFRNSADLVPEMLVRGGLPLALATLRLADRCELVDLDDPAVLGAEGLRPSAVATRDRVRTQAQATDLHRRHPRAAGLRWWSTLESLWENLTLFDRAGEALEVESQRTLDRTDPLVAEAATFLGLRV